jgi:NAD(P)-dependent dehydrogenase (short-subunit alcohol dehydrogenase family)
MGTILVTGASTGIGEACALHLDRLGHRVFAGVRRDEDGERLRGASSGQLEPVLLDVTDTDQIEAAAKQIGSDAGGVQGLVNNAGIGKGGPVEYVPLDDWRTQLEVNVVGQVAVTQAMLPLIRQGKGRVVFMGSIGGKSSTALTGPYNASKHAIEAIGESLRYELRPWDIWVAVVEPGAVKTPIWDKTRQEADRLERELPDEARERYGRHIAAIRKALEMQARRGVSPDRVARAVEHALFSTRPRTRYPVGPDARIQSAMVRLLPDKVREAVIRKVAGP